MIYFNTSAHNHTPDNSSHEIFCQDVLISMHRAFLMNGFHTLKADTLSEARTFLYTQLRSFNYHQRIAYLSSIDNHIELKNVTNIFYELFEIYDVPTYNLLADYFFEYWHFDFLWIELEEELYKLPWYYYFMQLLKDFKISNQIPIFIISMV